MRRTASASGAQSCSRRNSSAWAIGYSSSANSDFRCRFNCFDRKLNYNTNDNN